jgi:hypothetical protein
VSHFPPPPPPPPPPYYETAPKKKGISPWAIVGIIGFLVVIPCGLLIASGAFFANFFNKQMTPAMKCMVTISTARKALRSYANANSGKLPNAATWQTDIKPYFKAAESGDEDVPFDIVHGAGDVWECKAGDRTTAIYFNSELSEKILKDLKNPEKTIIVFEDDGQAKLNNAKPYVARPKTEAPKNRFGGSDWMRAPVEGEVMGFGGAFEDKDGKITAEPPVPDAPSPKPGT